MATLLLVTDVEDGFGDDIFDMLLSDSPHYSRQHNDAVINIINLSPL